MELADKHNRKVALIGRSIDNSAEIAQDLGYLDPPAGLLIHPGQIKEYADNELCILISGTQGEPMSSLSRAAVDNHKFAKIDAGDTVILSSRIIPGNEKAIYRVIDHLERRDARVIHDDGTNGLIHVSGHGSQEELRMMINLVRPKFFVPIHGDYRHLKRHAELAAATGIPEKVLLLEDGDVLELDRDGAEKVGKITTGRVCIDNNSTADVVEDTVIRDRKQLGGDGLFLPIIAINKRTGQVEGLPEISTRGFAADDPELMRNARDIVARTLEQSSEEERRDYGVMKDKIRGDLKRFIQKNANRRPLIMPIILEL
jgi:ribonuclease J